MGASKKWFMAIREQENNDDVILQEMASNDFVNTDDLYLEKLSIRQLEALLPAYYTHVDKHIRDLIAEKRLQEDRKYNVDDQNLLDATGGLIRGE